MTNDPTVQSVSPVQELPSSTVMVHSDVLRGCYAATLLELSPEQVIDFWRTRMPAHVMRRSDEWRWFDELLNGRTPVDIAVVNATLDELTRYLCREGVHPLTFLNQTTVKVNRGLPVSPGLLLKACSTFIRSLVHATDMRAFIVDHLQDFADNLTNGVGHRCLVRRVQDDWSTDLVGLWGPTLDSGAVGEWKLPKYDCAFWTMNQVAISPSYLGLPPFEEPYMVCDPRSISDVLSGRSTEGDGDTVVVDGRPAAKTVTWKAFRETRGLPDDCPGADTAPVVVAHREIACPRCGRKLLHEGCAYGAPLYVYGLHYRCLRQEITEPVFSRIVGEALGGRLLNREAVRRHKAVLEKVRRKLVVVYHAAEESISVDGRHLVRSVPAKMLRRMVRAYAESGQTEFEYREFCRDSSMVIDPSSPNISVRVQRLVKTLESSSDGLRVSRIARGRLRLAPRYPVEYSEEA